MELPLTPLAFADRARRLYSNRCAIVFDAVRQTYGEFLERCDRWSSRLQGLGVKRGVGVAHPRWGEAPHAFVVLKAGAAATEAELREFARQKLAHFKVPQRVTFTNELPKTATGKIQKFVLRGRAPAISIQ